MEKNFNHSLDIRRRVLIVDDEYVNRMLIANILEASGAFDISFAEDGQEALEILKENVYAFSLILLDLLMPRMSGAEFLERYKGDEELSRIPVIVMTSEKKREAESIQQGAIDFITKPFGDPTVVMARVNRIIELSEDRRMIQSASEDNLTGLYTKDFFFEYVEQMERADPDRTMDALVLNVDHFHLVNELFGRKFGDLVLRRIAETLNLFVNSNYGIACRSEADTFYVYCRHREDYTEIAQQISESLADLSQSRRFRVRVGLYPRVDKSVGKERWYDRAKQACDGIKDDYTRDIGTYDSLMLEKSLYQERLTNEIDDSIANKHFIVYYQPKYDITGETPRLVSAEALVRWRHPELGMISPGDFIPVFEKNGLIQTLDHYVWNEAARQIRLWKEKYGVTLPVSVNVSRIDIYDAQFEQKLDAILAENGLKSKDYMIEITETAYSDNGIQLIEVADRLRKRGFSIELDDFGSGYSSMNMIAELPIDVLKMDMRFVRNMMRDEKSRKLVGIVMDIAKFLNVPVVAEGVEDEAQYRVLKEMGCAVIQGYYFSRPLPPEEFEKRIEEQLEMDARALK